MSHRGSCRPDPVQQMLIRTVLAPEEKLVERWTEWQASSNLDMLDPGSLRLLPLLYHRLKETDLDPSDLKPYRNVYRHFWYRNRVYLKILGEVADILNDADMTPLLLKGLPLALETYPDPALRPMLDLDFWLPAEQLLPAVALLKEIGWSPDREPPAQPDITWLAAVKAIQLNHENGTSIDLHGSIMSEIADPDYDRQVLDRSHPTTVLGSRVRIPAVTDVLFHTIAHGLKWNPLPPFRWIVDAMYLLNAQSDPIDWKQLAMDAERTNLSTRLNHGLKILRQFSDTQGGQNDQYRIPLLELPRRSAWEPLEHLLKTRNHFLPAQIGLILFDGWRHIRRVPVMKKPGDSLNYIKLRWNVTHTRKLPVEAMSRFRRLFWPRQDQHDHD